MANLEEDIQVIQGGVEVVPKNDKYLGLVAIYMEAGIQTTSKLGMTIQIK